MSPNVANDARNKVELSAVGTDGLNLAIHILILNQLSKVLDRLTTVDSVLGVADDRDPCLGIWSCLEEVKDGLDFCEANDCFNSKDVRLSSIDQDLESWSVVLGELFKTNSLPIVNVRVDELFDTIGSDTSSDD